MQRNPTLDEAVVRRTVGPQTFQRGRDYAKCGAVIRVQWHEHAARVFGEVRGSAREPYTALVDLARSPNGRVTSFRGSCTCPVGINCKHAVALVLTAVSGVADDGASSASAWERSLANLGVESQPTAVAEAQVALQFEIRDAPAQPGTVPLPRIGMRPVLAGRSGKWVRTGISWSTIGYSRYARGSLHSAHLRLLGEIVALSSTAAYGGSYYYGHQSQTIYLDEIVSRRIWDLLAEARELGLPLIHAGAQQAPVCISAEPAELSFDISRGRSMLAMEPRIAVGAEQVLPAASALLGQPAHGLAWWQTLDEPDPKPTQRRLRLAALRAALSPGLHELFGRCPVHIPEPDEHRFLREYYPRLRQQVSISSADGSVTLPEPERPKLMLEITPLAQQRAHLGWHWAYGAADEYRREPLVPEPGSSALRDARAESEILDVAGATVTGQLLEATPEGSRIAPEQVVEGMGLVELATTVVPALAELPDVEVVGVDDLPDYREAQTTPVIEISGEPDAMDRDWFDLAVTVSVDGEDVPFQTLFVALASGESYLILPSGTYFSLDRPEFHQLAELITEARALQDAPSDSVRVSRFQTGLFDELARVGVISGQAAAWHEAVRRLCAAQLSAQPVPDGVHATLRDYQRSGYDWLAFLYEHGLGGILADDMGLGKTLQALALMARVREQQPDGAPFLVVAPTSVVSNWAGECHKFAPGLRTVTITGTVSRRGRELAELAAAADIVITSYTLFRLEYDDYAALDWAGMILDEAQFVKNHQSKGYQCAKKLPAPFKVAITGTPMENNLMELWSLLSITAPGLFPSPVRFDKYYRTPIEKGRSSDLLAQLRHRIRPLMLRRSKADVLTELPDKQEQVIELELNPKHRRVYQRHLQRERQKVLGLLGDLDGNRFEIFRSLTLLRQASLSAALVDDKHATVPSTKLDALMDQLGDVVGEGHRVLVFSQFTRFLEATRQRLEVAGIDHCYLDGKTRQRAAVLERFKSGSAPVFLVSLKAGGFGLNLTEADYCILLDPWWNPATEAQAVDRVHRIGQSNKVMVYRLVAKDTIEEKVMALKAAKAALFSSVMAEGTFADGALTAADIRALVE